MEAQEIRYRVNKKVFRQASLYAMFLRNRNTFRVGIVVVLAVAFYTVLAVLSVVLGVVLIVNPFGAMETLVMAIGIILIVEGAINLLSALYTVLALRRFAKLHPETQSMLEDLTGEDLNGDGVVAPEVTRTDAEATAVELEHVDESATVEQEERK